MLQILKSYSIVELKKEISKQNIKGYSKLKKDEVIALMMKTPEKFDYLKMKAKKERSEKQKANDKKLGEMAKNKNKKTEQEPEPEPEPNKDEEEKIRCFMNDTNKYLDVKNEEKWSDYKMSLSKEDRNFSKLKERKIRDYKVYFEKKPNETLKACGKEEFDTGKRIYETLKKSSTGQSYIDTMNKKESKPKKAKKAIIKKESKVKDSQKEAFEALDDVKFQLSQLINKYQATTNKKDKSKLELQMEKLENQILQIKLKGSKY